jgi:hypothetical protein
VDELREANRPSPLFAHLSAISEGIVALGWIVESRPADFVTDTLGGAQFYGNRVLKEYKDKSVNHSPTSSCAADAANAKQGTIAYRVYSGILSSLQGTDYVHQRTFPERADVE